MPALPHLRFLKKSTNRALIGVIHLPALAGAPGASRLHPAAALQAAGIRAVQEARVLTSAGFSAIILENFGDQPFYKDRVPPETVASMSVIAAAVREATKLPIGINVLRNDGRAALAIAAVTGCNFIRVNILSGVAATDQGVIEGDAAFLLRERIRLGAEDVAILADVHVKHAQSLSSKSIALAIEETSGRGGADAVIVTGATTGREVDADQLREASEAARHLGVPLLIGSGTNPKNIAELRPLVSGFLVGSSLRKGGRAGAPLEAKRIQALKKSLKG